MRKQYTIAAVLSVFFVLIIVAQYTFTADIRHDRQISTDLETIEENLRVRLSSIGVRQGPDLSEAIDTTKLPALEELDLDESLLERAVENNYELNYLAITPASDQQKVELCAVFRTDSSGDGFAAGHSYNSHTSGRSCFERFLYIW